LNQKRSVHLRVTPSKRSGLKIARLFERCHPRTQKFPTAIANKPSQLTSERARTLLAFALVCRTTRRCAHKATSEGTTIRMTSYYLPNGPANDCMPLSDWLDSEAGYHSGNET